MAAISLKPLIVPNCYENRTHREAIRLDMHEQLDTVKQHLGKGKTECDVCTFNSVLNEKCANKHVIETITPCI